MKNYLPGDTLHLNVRGTYFLISKRLLTSVPDSALEAFFSGRHQVELVDEKIFVDRDPKIFRQLIIYLHSGMKTIKFNSDQENQ